MIKFEIITIFPEAFKSYLSSSIIGRAVKNHLLRVKLHDLRQWAKDRRRTVDDRPFGGGPGMVLKVEPILRAVNSILKSAVKPSAKSKFQTRIILLSAKGKRFTQKDARRLSKYQRIILISGHYEGVDERIKKFLVDEEISLGEFVLTGGELPAMVVVDAATRLLPGVLGKKESLQDESFSTPGYLEYPHYTRPESLMISGKPRRVPKILLSGNHKKIALWRRKNAKIREDEN